MIRAWNDEWHSSETKFARSRTESNNNGIASLSRLRACGDVGWRKNNDTSISRLSAEARIVFEIAAAAAAA